MKETKLTQDQMKLVIGGTEEPIEESNKWKDRFGYWHWNTCNGLATSGIPCEGCTTAPKSEL